VTKSAQIDTVPHGVEEYRALREASPWHELVSMVHISHGMKEPVSPLLINGGTPRELSTTLMVVHLGKS